MAAKQRATVFDRLSANALGLFGRRRWEELVGQLWLDWRRVSAAARRDKGVPFAVAVLDALHRWEAEFRRTVEEGRYRKGRNGRRRRVARFSELEGVLEASGRPSGKARQPGPSIEVRRSW